MATETLVVYREKLGSFEEVGFLKQTDGALSFSYSDAYLSDKSAQSVSRSLPLGDTVFSGQAAKSFFEGILPEGSMRKSLSAAFHANDNDIFAFVERLNNESAGALVFKLPGEDPEEGRGYAAFDEGDFGRFADAPRSFAPHVISRSRLSLAGAQMKIGLFFDETAQSWFYPLGTAPSSHIVKACDGAFPGQTINEALCMQTARELGFETAECRLIPAGVSEPLISVKRFDRRDCGGRFLHRIHQEDFFQASPGFFDKYEPTDGHYASYCVHLVNEESKNPFGDRQLLFSRLLFDWAVGNADNHLKNHSFLWAADWSAKEVAPLYDITATTVYPQIDKEMGVSFGGSRRIDRVELDDVLSTAKSCGVNKAFAESEVEELLQRFIPALHKSIDCICNQGFSAAEALGRLIEQGFKERSRYLHS